MSDAKPEQRTPEQRARFEQAIRERDAQTVHGALGIKVERVGAEETVVSVEVTPRLFQHGGIVHGGVFVLLAESAASIAAASSVDLTKSIVAGMEINANHLRPVTSGTLRARAKPIHVGRTTFVYGIEIETEDGKLASVSRCTLALRKISGA
jgi:uncharacterized protein (TIGR00369 family)